MGATVFARPAPRFYSAVYMQDARADRRQAEALAAELQARLDQAAKVTAAPTWLG
ncbi:MAG: hypothetical protein NTV86_08665 [Planctomycetota bacterium]|nr:hypothetical protein [Planctomycetota bacterium]